MIGQHFFLNLTPQKMEQNKINEIRKMVEGKFNKNNAPLAIAMIGNFSGSILSENSAMLIDKESKRVYITHPSMLDSVYEPLITIIMVSNELGMSLSPEAKNFPEIIEIWEELSIFRD